MSSATGVSYNEKEMLEHRSLWGLSAPERPERLLAVLQRCRELGLIERCKFIEPRLATMEEISKTHSSGVVDALKTACDHNIDELMDWEKFKYLSLKYDKRTYIHPSTYAAAAMATGAVIDLTHNILEGLLRNGMAIIRPPGHHAMKSDICGYCYFNNVAVGATHALDRGLAKKILIVDFDVHHGQGTQQLFYNDPRVLYFSTHAYMHGKAWPNLKESNLDWTGSGDGIGFNCNVPLNKVGMGNTEFLTIWHTVLIPMAYKFNPDLVLVSAGFDAALNDHKGRMKVTPQCYPHLVKPLMGLAGGKVAVVLEGGYCLKALAEGAALVLRTLLDDPCPLIQSIKEPMPEIVETIVTTCMALRKYWPILTCTYLQEGAVFDLPSLRYDWDHPAPPYHSPVDSCPVESFENNSPFAEELNQLIATSNLSVPASRVKLGKSVSELLNKICRGNLMCGVVKLTSAEEVVQHINASTLTQRTLIVTLGQTTPLSKESNILNISINQEPSRGQSPTDVHITLTGDIGTPECFLIFTKLVLPLAYEFCPELVIFVIENEFKVSRDCLAHLTHLLSLLGNGRVVVMITKDDVIESQIQALSGHALPRLILMDIGQSSEEIAQLQKELGKNWSTLTPFCKRLPDNFDFKERNY